MGPYRYAALTGDNPLTAAATPQRRSVDDFLAEATPEGKLHDKGAADKGHMVAMTGDGTNDAPALAELICGRCHEYRNTVLQEAGNMVDLDSSPTKLIDIGESARQLPYDRKPYHLQHRGDGKILCHHPRAFHGTVSGWPREYHAAA